MKEHRTAALAAGICTAGLSLAACSGGVTTVGSGVPASSSPPASSAPAASPASSSASASSSAPVTSASTSTQGSTASGSGGTVTVGGPIGSFPVPPGATVEDNVTSGSEHDIVLGSVKPSAVSSFYASALPQAGYVIQSNTIGSSGSVSGAGINFTGHGYKGQIGAASGLGLGALTGGSDVIGITLTPQ